MILKKIGPKGLVCPHSGAIFITCTCILPCHLKIFSETVWTIKATFDKKHLKEVEIIACINNPGHVTNMVAMLTAWSVLLHPVAMYLFMTMSFKDLR